MVSVKNKKKIDFNQVSEEVIKGMFLWTFNVENLNKMDFTTGHGLPVISLNEAGLKSE